MTRGSPAIPSASNNGDTTSLSSPESSTAINLPLEWVSTLLTVTDIEEKNTDNDAQQPDWGFHSDLEAEVFSRPGRAVALLHGEAYSHASKWSCLQSREVARCRHPRGYTRGRGKRQTRQWNRKSLFYRRGQLVDHERALEIRQTLVKRA